MSSSPAIAAASAAVVALAVANRVLYKLALVPLKQYPFFLAQLTTFGYVAVYFSILYARYRAGVVTGDMLALPKRRLAAIGLLEALGLAAGMSAGAMLPGPAIPILSQSFLVWQLIFSALLLGRTYSMRQIIGCFLVASGVILAVASGANEGQFLSEVKFIWLALMVASSAFQAGASILKESVFIDGAKRLKGRRPDIFVVNSFGSGFQALFVFLLLPLLSNLKGIKFAELPAYLNGGAECFLNVDDSLIGNASCLEFIYLHIQKSSISTIAVYIGEYGLQYRIAQFGEAVICAGCFAYCYFSSANINLHTFTSVALHPSWRRVKFIFHPRRCGIADGADYI
ncbi:protein CLT2, chloroplastic isoform X2 [Oryza sativa Japonica Group]|uniref:protein CLT2, chloroplastic isoform X2 n=1 Tax=Oryza sativa subsp. japonica TaxID=39947 RepID=UPI00339CDC6F